MKSSLSGSYEALASQAQQYLRNNNYTEAQKIYERLYNRLSNMKAELINKRPHLKELLITSIRNLGDLSIFQGNYDDAIAYYQKGVVLDPDEQVQYRRATAQAKIDKGETESGLNELRALAVSNAGSIDAWIWLGLELSNQQIYDEAEESLQRATTLSDDEPRRKSDAYAYLHDLYREQEKFAEAEEAWAQVWKMAGLEMEDVSPLYQMYWETNNLAKAREWLGQEKNALRRGFYRGLFFQAEGSQDKADKAWQKTAQLKPLEYSEGHESWAEAALRSQVNPRSVALPLREVTSRGQMNLRGTLLLAVAEAKSGNLEGAHIALTAAVDLSQRTRPRRDNLSWAHWELFNELLRDSVDTAEFQKYFEEEAETEAEVENKTEEAPAETESVTDAVATE